MCALSGFFFLFSYCVPSTTFYILLWYYDNLFRRKSRRDIMRKASTRISIRTRLTSSIVLLVEKLKKKLKSRNNTNSTKKYVCTKIKSYFYFLLPKFSFFLGWHTHTHTNACIKKKRTLRGVHIVSKEYSMQAHHGYHQRGKETRIVHYGKKMSSTVLDITIKKKSKTKIDFFFCGGEGERSFFFWIVKKNNIQN